MNDLVHQYSYILQLLLLSAFWMKRLKRRPLFGLRAVACVAALCGAVTVLEYLLQRSESERNWILFSLPYMLILCLFGVSLWVCFDAPTDLILLTLLLPSTAQVCASSIGDMLYYALHGTRTWFLLFDLGSTLVMCVICAGLSKLYDKVFFYDKDTYRVINTLSYCLVLCIFSLSGFSPDIEDRFARYVLVGGYRFLIGAFVFFLILSLLSVGRMRYEKNMTDVLLKKQKQQYALARELTELVSIKYHDMKHMENTERELMEENRRGLSRFECVINCGNSALDTVLTEKSIICKRNRINFTMMVDGALLDFMEPIDIYALFGNILDNAINCLAKLPAEERHLKLRVAEIGSMVSILCENVCHDSLRFENGLPRTESNDEYNHGFGTKSVARICGQYGAEFRMSCDEELFVIKILIPAKGK